MERAPTLERLASVEISVSEGFMAPLHAHGADEALHVLEGCLTVYAGEETIRVGPGQTFVVPQGVVHTFRTEVRSRSVFTTFTSSASRYEHFLRATGPVSADRAWSTDEDAATVQAVAAAAEISVYGPPGTLPPGVEQAFAA